jgi:hypothetical protein
MSSDWVPPTSDEEVFDNDLKELEELKQQVRDSEAFVKDIFASRGYGYENHRPSPEPLQVPGSNAPLGAPTGMQGQRQVSVQSRAETPYVPPTSQEAVMDRLARNRYSHAAAQDLDAWNLRQKQHYWNLWTNKDDPWRSDRKRTLKDVWNTFFDGMNQRRPPGPDPRPYSEKHPETHVPRATSKLDFWLRRLHRTQEAKRLALRDWERLEMALEDDPGSRIREMAAPRSYMDTRRGTLRNVDRRIARYERRVDKWARRVPNSGYGK